MTKMTCMIFWMVFLLYCQLGRTNVVCPSGQISCKSGDKCIDLAYVCRSGKQCTDGSDEDPSICSFWKYDTNNCGSNQMMCNSRCLTMSQLCLPNYGCSSARDKQICELVKMGKLMMRIEEPGMVLNDELVGLFQKAVNMTLVKYSSSPCPMFYNKVGNMCVSFFSPAKLPWAEARQFCLSLMGDLLDITDVNNHGALLQYMRISEITTDYWIGGRFDLDTNSWSWVADDTPMPLGSPYWATRYSSSCVPRSPPHNDPFSTPGAALPGAPCFNNLQAPAQRKQGWCAALTYEHYYYFSDELCQDNRSPLCIYVDHSSERDQKTTTN